MGSLSANLRVARADKIKTNKAESKLGWTALFLLYFLSRLQRQRGSWGCRRSEIEGLELLRSGDHVPPVGFHDDVGFNENRQHQEDAVGNEKENAIATTHPEATDDGCDERDGQDTHEEGEQQCVGQ